MKKLITILIILVLAGGAAFYFGWVNVDPGTFAVAHSTLTGTLDYPLESGRLHWLWQKLIPRSFHLFVVNKEPRTLVVESSYPLPGSENLRDYGSFELGVRATLQYRIDFESASLLVDQGILDSFSSVLESRISSGLKKIISSFILEEMAYYEAGERPVDYRVLDRLRGEINRHLASTAGSFRLKEVTSVAIITEIPQIIAYNQAVEDYLAYLDSLSIFKEEELRREARIREQKREEDVEIERYRRYGELITRYPQLLKYFYIQKIGDNVEVIVLPQDTETGFPSMLELRKFLEEVPPSEGPPREEAIPEEEPERALPEPEQPVEEKAGAPEEGPPREKPPTKEKKWYEYLKFWNFLQKD